MKFIVRPNRGQGGDNIEFWKMHYGCTWGYLINVFSAPSSFQGRNDLVAFVAPQGGKIQIVSTYSVSIDSIEGE